MDKTLEQLEAVCWLTLNGLVAKPVLQDNHELHQQLAIRNFITDDYYVCIQIDNGICVDVEPIPWEEVVELANILRNMNPAKRVYYICAKLVKMKEITY